MANFDDDLQQLFAGEVQERTARLVAGAEAIAAGPLDEEAMRTMIREGHTIKGTARMMGFTAISDAGKALEDAWRAIGSGEITPDGELAAALALLAAQMVSGVGADPATGTPGLATGMRALRRALRQDEPVVRTVESRPTRPHGDLDGLLGAIDSWAFGETVRVNAAGLFRLINEICSLRVDSEALAGAVAKLARARLSPDALSEELTVLTALVESADKALLDLQSRAVELAAAPLSDITATFTQLVRYVSRHAGKEVRFEIVGDEHAVDRQVLERLSDPLRHLVVNAVQHGIETPAERQAGGKPPTATLLLHADVQDHRLSIVVEDDGRGIDWAAVRYTALRRGLVSAAAADDLDALRAILFSPNFSTAQPSEMIGEGQGLATVAAAVEALHGTVTLDSRAGEGTRITMTVPTSRALQDAVLVTAAGQTWGIPAIAVLDRVPLTSAGVRVASGREEMTWNGSTIPVLSFAEAVGLRKAADPTRVVIVSTSLGPTGFTVVPRAWAGARSPPGNSGRSSTGCLISPAPRCSAAAMWWCWSIPTASPPTPGCPRDWSALPGVGHRRLAAVPARSSPGALGSAGFEVDLAASPHQGALRACRPDVRRHRHGLRASHHGRGDPGGTGSATGGHGSDRDAVRGRHRRRPAPRYSPPAPMSTSTRTTSARALWQPPSRTWIAAA